RDRHAGGRRARSGGVHPAPEPGELVHGALDADPRTHVHRVRAVRARRRRRGTARPCRSARMTALLSLDHVTRHFGALAAVNGVSLDVAAEERRAIIGPNGPGKTPLFNLVTRP